NGTGDSRGIFEQLFDAQGNRVGPERLVNVATSFAEVSPSVAMDKTGAFIITWDAQVTSGGKRAARFQRFDSAGVKVGSQVDIAQGDGVGGSRVAIATSGPA